MQSVPSGSIVTNPDVKTLQSVTVMKELDTPGDFYRYEFMALRIMGVGNPLVTY